LFVIDLSTGLLNRKINVGEEIERILLIGNQYVIGSTASHKIKLWDLITSKFTCEFNNTNADVMNLVLLNEKYFASSHFHDVNDFGGNLIKIWNYKTCSLVYKISTNSYINAFDLIGNGLLASYSDDGLMRIIDVNALKLKANFSLKYFRPPFYFNEKYFVMKSYYEINILKISDFSIHKTIRFYMIYYTELFLTNEYIFALYENEIQVFSILNGSLVKKLDGRTDGHRNKITDGVLFKNSGLLVTSGLDQFIKIWDCNKLSLKYTLDLYNSAQINPSFKLLSIGSSYLLVYGVSNQSKIFDLNNGDLVQNINVLLADNVIANVSSNFVIPFATTTNKIQTTTKSTAKTTTKSIPSNVPYSLITSTQNSKLKIWSLKNGKINFTLDNFNPDVWNEGVEKLLVIDSKFLCSAHSNGLIKLWNLQKKSLIVVINNETSYRSPYIEYLGNGLLATSKYTYNGNSNKIQIWNLYPKFQLKYEINMGANSNAFFYIGNGLLQISQDNLLWDIEKKVYKSLFKRANEYFCGLFSLNQTHIASLIQNENTKIRIYSISNLNTYSREHLLTDEVSGTQMYFIDNNYIAASFGDFRIMVINVNTGMKKCLFSANSHRNTILTIVKVGNGLFASAGLDALIKIWDINTCSLIATFDNYENNLAKDQIIKLVSIDGFYLASLSAYSTAKVWDLSSLTLRYRFNSSDTVGDLINNDMDFFKN
jgi:WD40 repeat protein